MKPSIIVFIGLDGSGKTTQVKNVKQYLLAKGIPIHAVWMRNHLSFSSFIWSFFKKIEKNAGLNAEWHTMPYLLKKSPSRIWALIEYISIFPSYLFKVVLPLKLNNTVIMDRCPIDTLVYLEKNTRTNNFIPPHLLCMTIIKMMKNAKIFFIIAERDVIAKRRSDDKEIEYDLETLYYFRILKYFEHCKIDTTHLTIDENFSIIKSIINDL